MELHWQKVPYRDVTHQIADYRLSRTPGHYPAALGTIWWSALVDLRDTSIEAFEHAVKADFPDALLIPDDYDAAERMLHPGDQLVTIYARSDVLDALNTEGGRYGVGTLYLGAITPTEVLDFDPGPASDPEPEIVVPEGTVLTAVIDDGIAFANNLFRDGAVRSRVEYANILTTRPTRHGRRVTVGRVLTRSEIDALLRDCTYCGLLDEEQFYRRAGLIDFFDDRFSPAAFRTSHGTHVMGLAAGYDMRAAPPDRPILCAILPPRVTEDVTGQNLLPSLNLALKRLHRQAGRFRLPGGAPAPAVFNFSYGNFGGPHDGTSPIARLIERYFGPDSGVPYRLVLPAGNGNLARAHALAEFPQDLAEPARRLDLMALPDDRTATHIEMWMPYSPESPPPAFVTVRVTPPGVAQSGPVRIAGKTYQSLRDRNDIEVARLSYSFAPDPTCRGLITLSLNPTASLTDATLAPAGLWKIDIAREDISADQAVQIWVERDETLPGFKPGGRQAYFDNACYRRFDRLGAPLPVDPPNSDCPVRRAGTLSGFACGASPLVIAALTQKGGLLSDYSTAGPITPVRGAPIADRTGPDASARADDSPVLAGVLNAGSHSGSMVRLSGTSAAAPRVARFTGDGIACGAPGDRAWIRAQAEKQDHLYPGPKPAETRTGGGRLDIAVRVDGRAPRS